MSTTITRTIPPAELASRLRHPTGRTLRAAVSALAAAGMLAGAVAAASPAQATGSIANYCAVTEYADAEHPVDRSGGYYVDWLPCGAGTHNIARVTFLHHPFFVKMVGYAPFCMQAGHFHYPRNGGRSVDVLTPTVRCRS